MMEKEKELDTTTKSDEQTMSGRVKQICQNFLVHADSGLAHRLQEEEFAVHFDRNRVHRRESRLGVKVARDVEEEEKKTFFERQSNLYQQKKKIEESDIEIARQLQEEIRLTSTSRDLSDHRSDHYSSDGQNHYEKMDQLPTLNDTSSDEQLARILQEEEQLLACTSYSPRFTTKYT